MGRYRARVRGRTCVNMKKNKALSMPLESKDANGNIPVIVAKGLKKVFTNDGMEVQVLKDVNCSVDPGELVGIVGASGVGKTTFLHILGTLDRPTRGTVLHFGNDVFSWDDKRLSRFRNKEIGFVFQYHYLLPEFSALENVMMPCILSGVPRQEARAMAEKTLSELGLAHRLCHRPGSLSGGEQQRVALARAMVRGPRILLADEPTGNLDEKTGEKVAELIFSLNRRYGTTVVIVTHDLSLACKLDRCLGLMDGRAIALDKEDLKEFGVGTN